MHMPPETMPCSYRSELDVVASYMSRVEDPETGEEHAVVEYFDKDALHDFLTKRARRDQVLVRGSPNFACKV